MLLLPRESSSYQASAHSFRQAARTSRSCPLPKRRNVSVMNNFLPCRCTCTLCSRHRIPTVSTPPLRLGERRSREKGALFVTRPHTTRTTSSCPCQGSEFLRSI